MFLGHYGIAFAAKSVAPRTSLGTFAFAAQFLDELWPILLLAGVEQARIAPGLMAANQIDFVSYPISHSLLTAAGWAVLVGGLYFARRRYGLGAAALGIAVLSHWFLDAPMHRPDLPLWPGSTTLVGAGAWNSIALTILLDVGVFVAGLASYVRSTKARDRIGAWGLWSLIVALGALFVVGTFGPPPPNERSLALGGLGLWLVVPWMYWVDRHRVRLDRPQDYVARRLRTA